MHLKLTKNVEKFIALWFVVLLGGCSASTLLSKLSGADSYISKRDIPYGRHPKQKMDIYLPTASTPRASNMRCQIMFVYGGSWQSGSKANYGFVGAALAKAGYKVVVPDYRKYPDVVFPDFIHDLAAVLDHPTLAKHNDSQKTVVIGHSAGALNVALLAYDPHYLKAVGLHPSVIDVVISISGPHDFFLPSEKEKWQAIFGGKAVEQIQALSVNHVSRESPTTLILHGEMDDVVTPRSANSLADKLSAHHVKHSLKIYPGVGHRRIVAAMSPLLSFLAPTIKDIIKFLKNNECHPVADIAE